MSLGFALWRAVSVEVHLILSDMGIPHTLRGSMPGGDMALDVAMEVKELGSNPLTVLQFSTGMHSITNMDFTKVKQTGCCSKTYVLSK